MVIKRLWGFWGALFDLDNPNDIVNNDDDDPSPLDEEILAGVISFLVGFILLFRGQGKGSTKKIKQKRKKRVKNAR